MTTKDYQTRSPLRIFLSYFKPHRRLFVLDLSCAFLIACIDLAFPLVSRAAMYTWLPQRQFRVFFIVMAVVVAAYVLRSALYFVVAYWGHSFGIRVEAEGVAVHGSTPELGENAIGRLAMALAQLPFTGETGECLAFVSERLGMETHGESLGLAMRDGISGDLTMNVGVASFENKALSLTFSVRYPVTLPYELVYPRLKRGFTLGGFTETEMTHAAALYIPKDSELIRRLLGVYEAETGEKAEPKCIGGGTYAKSMPNIVAFGPIFPEDEVREHKPDEYMETRRVMQNAEIIASAMKALAE